MKSFILGVLGGLVGSSAFYYFSIEAFAPANAQVQKAFTQRVWLWRRKGLITTGEC
jgi:hypothetical protein